MSDHVAVTGAIASLQKKTPLQRHAIFRLLKTDGPSLRVLEWGIDQPDCDVATASMVFWRLLCLPEDSVHSVQDRIPVLEVILKRMRSREYARSGITWDGVEPWDRSVLIGGTPRIDSKMGEFPNLLFGPFIGESPEAASHAFFDSPYEEDDAFDSLWRTNPNLVAAADWLAGKPADLWMAAVDLFDAAHPDELYRWIVLQPECPAPVAGQIFWMSEPLSYARRLLSGHNELRGTSANVLGLILARWRTGGFVAHHIDFSRYAHTAKYRALLSECPGGEDPLQIPADLLEPIPGLKPEDPQLLEDFNFWCIERSIGALVPRPRSAAIAAWKPSLKATSPEPKRKWGWRDLFRSQGLDR